jgi:NADH:ubiquinone oxidoreductase subunit B-like Fe-S oxidoreductase
MNDKLVDYIKLCYEHIKNNKYFVCMGIGNDNGNEYIVIYSTSIIENIPNMGGIKVINRITGIPKM